jgi:hypothetical protein
MGWRKRKLSALDVPSQKSRIDFVFENPADGYFKSMPFMRQLLDRFPHWCRATTTSYCKYEADYRKRTVFISSLKLRLAPPCPNPVCSHLKQAKAHPRSVTDLTSAEKNSLPQLVVNAILDQWMAEACARHANRFYVVVDVFAGFGSVSEAIRQRQLPNVRVFGNDIVARNGGDLSLDMSASSPFSLSSLAWLACAKMGVKIETYTDVIAMLEEEQIGLLFHLSTPCTTYSTNGLGHHRHMDRSPKTPLAQAHDALNTRLVDELERMALW